MTFTLYLSLDLLNTFTAMVTSAVKHAPPKVSIVLSGTSAGSTFVKVEKVAFELKSSVAANNSLSFIATQFKKFSLSMHESSISSSLVILSDS